MRQSNFHKVNKNQAFEKNGLVRRKNPKKEFRGSGFFRKNISRKFNHPRVDDEREEDDNV